MRTLRSLPDTHVHKCSALGILNGLSHWTDLEKNLYFQKVKCIGKNFFYSIIFKRSSLLQSGVLFFGLDTSWSTVAVYKRCLQLGAWELYLKKLKYSSQRNVHMLGRYSGLNVAHWLIKKVFYSVRLESNRCAITTERTSFVHLFILSSTRCITVHCIICNSNDCQS
jgi:hypothetical protein